MKRRSFLALLAAVFAPKTKADTEREAEMLRFRRFIIEKRRIQMSEFYGYDTAINSESKISFTLSP